MNNESLPGNPHVTGDLHLYASGSSSANQATVAATLALAFEQRTANLIAMTALVVECLNTKRGIDDESAAILNARLGLDGEQA